MELLKYLNEHFLTLDELLDSTQITECKLREFQQAQMMPKASYTLDLNVTCDSFFGLHDEHQKIEFYAKGYCAWIGIFLSLKNQKLLYEAFSGRYSDKIDALKLLGHVTEDPKLTSSLSLHIEQEWGHFLDGIYGLCTESGLPEDIAAKEFAIVEINELADKPELSRDELVQLKRAVDLLDKASSKFAPHERPKSSRQRLVNDVRRQYRL